MTETTPSAQPIESPRQLEYRMTCKALRNRRWRLAGTWVLLSLWEGVPIYLAFMRLSDNPSKEIAVALALALCWVPVVGTAAAIVGAVWAWELHWWVAVAMYVTPKVLYMVVMRAAERRYPKHGR